MINVKPHTLVIALLVFIFILQLSLLFSHLERVPLEDTSELPSSPPSYENTSPLTLHDLAAGILILQNERALSGEQKEKLLKSLQNDLMLKKTLYLEGRELESIFNPEQFLHIRYNQSISISVDPGSAVSAERQMIQAAINALKKEEIPARDAGNRSQ